MRGHQLAEDAREEGHEELQEDGRIGGVQADPHAAARICVQEASKREEGMRKEARKEGR